MLYGAKRNALFRFAPGHLQVTSSRPKCQHSILLFIFCLISILYCSKFLSCSDLISSGCRKEMVRNYKRKTNRASWTSESVNKASQDVKSGKLSLRQAATAYEIPLTTLHRHFNGNVKKAPGVIGRFQLTFSDGFELELKEHLLNMSGRFYGLSAKDVRRLAFDLAEQLGLQHPFNKDSKMAGEDWLFNFLRRNKLGII